MLTHRGLISGYGPASDVVCIQAPVNRGHSGSALLAPDGHVIGIISMREGRLGKELEATQKLLREVGPRLGGISHEIETSEGRKSISETQLLIATVDTLDKYINTGIGYARATTFLRSWLQRHPLKEQ